VTCTLLCVLPGKISRASAEEQPSATQASAAPAPGSRSRPAPGLDLRAAPPSTDGPSILRGWWFWTAVGAIAAGTVAVIVVSSRGSAPPPTNLGNQTFQR
jgi:hypothetical protein